MVGRELYHREATRGPQQACGVAIRAEMIAGRWAEFCWWGGWVGPSLSRLHLTAHTRGPGSQRPSACEQQTACAGQDLIRAGTAPRAESGEGFPCFE